MTSTEKIALRPHQVEAVDVVVRGLDSARKHGLNAFDAIRQAFTGNL